jgi:hypothetical protein
MGKNRKSKYDSKPTDEWIREICKCYNEGKNTKEVAKEIGCTPNVLSVWKLILHSYLNTDKVFRDITLTNNDEEYIKFKKNWEMETERYWKTHEDRPEDRLLSMCIARYGLQTTTELLSAWTLLKGKGQLFRFLREEYI